MPPYCYFEKKFMPVTEAKLGIMTHALHYGTAVFEGIRGNWNDERQQVYLFRCLEHYQRLLRSCKILKISLPYTAQQLVDITVECVERSGFKEDVYLRPLAYKASQALGVRLHSLEDDFLVYVTTFPAYLDLDKGVRCCVSSWRRIDDNMIPARAKVCGLYVNNALAKTEAIENGYDEAIMLNMDGHVSEGSGENLFLVIEGKLVTPASSDNILMGITRDSIITLAREELGMETVERCIDRSELYTGDECFLTGTAAHVTPVTEIDHRPIGTGKNGEITLRLQQLYFDAQRGKLKKYAHWLTPAYRRVRA